MKRALLLTALAAFLVAFVLWLVLNRRSEPPSGPRPIADATFACNGSQTINATFYDTPNDRTPAPGTPPVPTGSARVALSDGRIFNLRQTISADGVRYATADGSLIFWTKGNGAFVLENNRQTYMGCIIVSPDPGGLPQVYTSENEGFSIRHPEGYGVDSAYVYQAMGPSGPDIRGVKFTIPPAVSAGTNLSADTNLAVERIPDSGSCRAEAFLPSQASATTVVDGGTTYSTATWREAGAGNRYEEIVYALPGTNPCIAVRYFIHYTVFENYPPGTVKEFDKQALVEQFDKIRRTLRVDETGL